MFIKHCSYGEFLESGPLARTTHRQDDYLEVGGTQ